MKNKNLKKGKATLNNKSRLSLIKSSLKYVINLSYSSLISLSCRNRKALNHDFHKISPLETAKKIKWRKRSETIDENPITEWNISDEWIIDEEPRRMIKVDWVDVLWNPQSSTIIDSPKTYKPDGRYL